MSTTQRRTLYVVVVMGITMLIGALTFALVGRQAPAKAAFQRVASTTTTGTSTGTGTSTNTGTSTMGTSTGTTGTSTTGTSTNSTNTSTTSTNNNGTSTNGSSSSTSGGIESLGNNADFDMRLSKASISLVNLSDDQEEYAKFTFTKPIQTLNDDPSGFHVTGYQSSTTVDASSVRLDQTDQKTVIVGFPAGTDLQAYTAATTDSGVVETIDQHGNVQDAVHLQGGGRQTTAGLTSAPELVSVSQNRSLNQIQYNMDQFLDDSGGSASALGYYTNDGRMHTASDIVSTHNRNIIAQFDADQGNRVEDAVRWFVLEDAATSKQGQSTITTSIGGATAAPDLTSVSSVGTSRTQWLYTFDEPIRNVDPSMFHIYTGDGTQYDATSATIRGTSQVLASFPDVREFKGQVRVATVDKDAVLALVGSDESNTVGSASVATRASADLTSGPDLTGATRDTGSGQVTFRFDTRLDDSSIPDPANFAVITTSGSVVPGTSVDDINRDGGTVTVQFDNAAVETAEGVIVNADAVTDFQGSGNIADALKPGTGSTLTATLGAAQSPTGGNALGTTSTTSKGAVTQLLPNSCTPDEDGCS